MPDIDTILDNILQYKDDIDNLVRQLKAIGINSLKEFKQAARESGAAVPASIQAAVEQKFTNSDEDDWNEARIENTEDAYMKYLSSHPEGKGNHRGEARSAIARLQEIAANGAADAEWENINKSNLEDVARFLLNNPDSRYRDEVERIIWDAVDKTNQEELSQYTSRFPDSSFISEANRLLRDLRREIYLGVDIKALAKQMKDIQTDKRFNNPEKTIYDRIVSYLDSGKIKRDDLMQALREDHNFISSTVANLLWENGKVSDFSQADIDPAFITYMISNQTTTQFEPSAKLDRVTKVPCTEIYFWGIPSSGKSCALGAILSAANSGKVALSMEKDNDCKGYGYMTRLANLFRNNGSVGALPEGTPVKSTYEMGFNLEDQDKKVHPITCIDLAGELVRCMYKKDAGEPLSDDQLEVLQTLTDVMIDNRTQNRKLHFFVIEYGAEDRLYEGLPQQDYLQAAAVYIKKTGIFEKDTDGLYLLISKVDKAKAQGKELREKLKDYIHENYQGFYNELKKICRDNEINGGEVEIIPFTLGEVCFQNYCKFNDQAAAKVVNKIIERTYGYKPGKMKRFMDALKK